MRSNQLLVLVLLIVATTNPSVADAEMKGYESVGDSVSCKRIDFSERPTWVPSATVLDGNLLLVNISKNRLELFSPSGELIRTVGSISSGRGSEPFAPTIVQKLSNMREVAVENGDGVIAFLDTDLELINQVPLLNLESRENWKLGSVFDWALVGKTLYGFGDFERPEKQWASAFFKVSSISSQRKIPGDLEIINHIELDNRGRMMYLLGLRFFAEGPGNSVVYAEFSPEPILMIGSSVASQAEFAGEAIPPHQWQPSSSPIKRLQDLNEYEGVHGVYSDGERIWQLEKMPHETTFRWQLREVVQSTQREPVRVLVDSQASQLTLAMSENVWFLVEKEEIRSLGDQAIQSFISLNPKVLDFGSSGSTFSCSPSR